jgi:hypothetical protein
MLNCGYPYSSMDTEREASYNPYGNTIYYQRQPITPGMAPSVTPGMAPGMAPGGGLPTGIPTGPPYGGVPLTTAMPTTPSATQPPQTVQSPYYTAGYLRKFIGRDVRVEFLIGTGGPLVDRIGTLLEVGASYITLRPIRSSDTLMCDLYSIKFVTIYSQNSGF